MLHDQDGNPDPLPFSTRAHWMRVANAALLDLSPCPFMAFGTAIVNHTAALTRSSSPPADDDDDNDDEDATAPPLLGDLICTGVNHNNHTGNPSLDGELAALANCSAVLTDPAGRFRLSPAEAVAAYEQLSLYTNGEPCPMCAAAVAWAGFRECLFGTAIPALVRWGWPQIELRTAEVLARAWRLPRRVRLFGGVLANETDAWFGWQWPRRDGGGQGACPKGCERGEGGEGRCSPV
ncbi:hypothetical protein MBLNU459_g3879t1 [Dothideomycetes sp. NU459]